MKGVDIRNLVNQYEFSCVLPGSKQEVKFKPVTTGQMKKLLVYEGEEDIFKVEELLDDLISSSVLTEGFDIKKLYLQDRFYLLIELRKKTKGSDYTFTFHCPVCKKENLANINLDELPVKEFSENLDDIKVNEQISFRMGYVTREDQLEAYEYSKGLTNVTNNQRLIEAATYLFAKMAKDVVVDGQVVEGVDVDDKMYVINNSPETIMVDLKKWQDSSDFGISFRYKIKCSCGFDCEDDIPSDGFFT